jgi:hypothetical protein
MADYDAIWRDLLVKHFAEHPEDLGVLPDGCELVIDSVEVATEKSEGE